MRKWSWPLLNKGQLRKELCHSRRAISKEHRKSAAASAANLFVAHPLFKSCQHIGCYLARDDEFDASAIINEIWQAKKHCYLPVMSTGPQKILEFANYQMHDSLKPNRYNILEPETQKYPPEQLDLVLIPLVGFDLQGHRLGMGGGYYDKSFAFVLEKKPSKPILLGLAYEQQQVQLLPYDSWDVDLDGVLTEKDLLLFNIQDAPLLTLTQFDNSRIEIKNIE